MQKHKTKHNFFSTSKIGGKFEISLANNKQTTQQLVARLKLFMIFYDYFGEKKIPANASIEKLQNALSFEQS